MESGFKPASTNLKTPVAVDHYHQKQQTRTLLNEQPVTVSSDGDIRKHPSAYPVFYIFNKSSISSTNHLYIYIHIFQTCHSTKVLSTEKKSWLKVCPQKKQNPLPPRRIIVSTSCASAARCSRALARRHLGDSTKN